MRVASRFVNMNNLCDNKTIEIISHEITFLSSEQFFHCLKLEEVLAADY